MTLKGTYPSKQDLSDAIKAARGEIECDIVFANIEFLDVFSGHFVRGDVGVYKDKIVGTCDKYTGKRVIDGSSLYLVPGFIDSHVHIESSLMTPRRFQQAALPHGTTTAIWDPHEIANVKGVSGIEWAITSTENLLLDFFIMIPSCVPSTSPNLGLETSGAELGPAEVKGFRNHPRVLGLAEMMNFPGLLNGEDDVLEKIGDCQGLRRDGHCPSLSGKDLNAYGVAGIHSCHESTRLEEAREKLTKGIQVLIREGSCAKDAEELLPLLNSYTSSTVALCSDDRNPADIAIEGHIDHIVNMALHEGHRPADIFRAASYSPAMMYGLNDRGAIAPGYIADLVVVKPKENSWLNGVSLLQVFKSGKEVNETALEGIPEPRTFDNCKNLNINPLEIDQLKVSATEEKEKKVPVIGVIPRQILTKKLWQKMDVNDGEIKQDLANDIIKIGVFERHHGTGNTSIAFVKGFNLKKGAIATSINHDSHNIIAVGANDIAMCDAINKLIKIDGGIVVVDGEGASEHLTLPIAGLMTTEPPKAVAASLRKLKKMATDIGCLLEEPFLQLSFLALPVIPSLKITDKGLVDVDAFQLLNW